MSSLLVFVKRLYFEFREMCLEPILHGGGRTYVTKMAPPGSWFPGAKMLWERVGLQPPSEGGLGDVNSLPDAFVLANGDKNALPFHLTSLASSQLRTGP